MIVRGPATQTLGGSLVHLRALDFLVEGPFQDFPTVFVYHPEPGNGHPFATVSWTSFIGAIAGISSADVSISQKVWIGYEGKDSRVGIPFHFLLRDILQVCLIHSSFLVKTHQFELV